MKCPDYDTRVARSMFPKVAIATTEAGGAEPKEFVRELQLAALQARFAEIPITKTLDLKLVGVDEGIAVMSIGYRFNLDGVSKSLHGGLLMTLADTAACAAVMTLTGTQASITTADMNIHFWRPVALTVSPQPR